MTSDEIKALLNEKYSDGDQCLIAFEVNEGTGSSSGRRIDALAMYLWPSRDYEIIGFEIKVSRSDWLNERKQPEKSQAISQFCDKFYLVAPEGVLGIDELPKTWGYIKAKPDSLYTKVRAPKREPIVCDRPFMASLLRSMTRKYGDKKLLNAEMEKINLRNELEIEKRIKNRYSHMERELAHYKEMVQKFNEATGMELTNWSFGKIAHLANLVANPKKKEDYIDALYNQIHVQETVLDATRRTLDDLKSVKNTNNI